MSDDEQVNQTIEEGLEKRLESVWEFCSLENG